MDTKAIQELLRLVNKSDLTEVEIESEGFKIRIKRQSGSGEGAPYQPQAFYLPSDALSRAPQAVTAEVVQQLLPGTAPAATAKAAEAAPGNHIINSPMIGTFYVSSSPDKDAFVKAGDSISPGQTLCIIEAMKLFNEIECEVSGRVVRVLVNNAQPVEYDQPLFEVELVK
jgi:acetyl-CoA carboxylase biotin carboxyl carrier protein